MKFLPTSLKNKIAPRERLVMGLTKKDLYALAKKYEIKGRGSMNKEQLERAVHAFEKKDRKSPKKLSTKKTIIGRPKQKYGPKDVELYMIGSNPKYAVLINNIDSSVKIYKRSKDLDPDYEKKNKLSARTGWNDLFTWGVFRKHFKTMIKEYKNVNKIFVPFVKFGFYTVPAVLVNTLGLKYVLINNFTVLEFTAKDKIRYFHLHHKDRDAIYSSSRKYLYYMTRSVSYVKYNTSVLSKNFEAIKGKRVDVPTK